MLPINRWAITWEDFRLSQEEIPVWQKKMWHTETVFLYNFDINKSTCHWFVFNVEIRHHDSVFWERLAKDVHVLSPEGRFPRSPFPMFRLLYHLLSEAFGLNGWAPPKSLPTGLLTALLTIYLSSHQESKHFEGRKYVLFTLVCLCCLLGPSEAKRVLRAWLSDWMHISRPSSFS